jgi:hypothetical protein
MRRVLVLVSIWLLLGGAGQAFAGLCVPGTVTDYVSLGSGGCTIGSLSFSNFSVEAFPSATAQIDPSGVVLIPSSDGFVLSSDELSAQAGELLGLRFLFLLNAPQLIGGTVALGERTVTENGAITSILSADSAGVAIAFDIGLDAEPVASFTSAPSSFFDVFVELGIDGGTFGAATMGPNLGSVSFASQATVPVPEPGVLWLMLSSALSLLLLRRPRPARGRA